MAVPGRTLSICRGLLSCCRLLVVSLGCFVVLVALHILCVVAQGSLVRSLVYSVTSRSCQRHGVCAAGHGLVQVLRMIVVVSAVAGTVLPVPWFHWDDVSGSVRQQVPRGLEVWRSNGPGWRQGVCAVLAVYTSDCWPVTYQLVCMEALADHLGRRQSTVSCSTLAVVLHHAGTLD